MFYVYHFCLNVNKHITDYLVCNFHTLSDWIFHWAYLLPILAIAFHILLLYNKHNAPCIKHLTCPSSLYLIRQTTIPCQRRPMLTHGQSLVARHRLMVQAWCQCSWVEVFFCLICMGSYQCTLLIMGCYLTSLPVHKYSSMDDSLLYVFITDSANFTEVCNMAENNGYVNMPYYQNI